MGYEQSMVWKIEWNGNFGTEYGRCQNGMDWKFSIMKDYIPLELSNFWTFLKSHGYCSFFYAYDLKKYDCKTIFEIGHRFDPPHRL